MQSLKLFTLLAIAGFMLVGCSSTPKEPDQVSEAMSAEGEVDVDATNKKNHAAVAEMKANATLANTYFKFMNTTGYRVWMIVKSPYGKWEGWISANNETTWTKIPHDGTVWVWAYGYINGVQKVSWKTHTVTVRPGVEYFTYSFKP